MEKLSNEELLAKIRQGFSSEQADAEREILSRISAAQQAFDKIVEIANKMLEGK